MTHAKLPFHENNIYKPTLKMIIIDEDGTLDAWREGGHVLGLFALFFFFFPFLVFFFYFIFLI